MDKSPVVLTLLTMLMVKSVNAQLDVKDSVKQKHRSESSNTNSSAK